MRRIIFLHNVLAAAAGAHAFRAMHGTRSPAGRACLPNASLCEGVGRAYLREHPHEAYRDVLRRLLSEPSSPAMGDDTVLADRWVLTRSEARRCALAVLER